MLEDQFQDTYKLMVTRQCNIGVKAQMKAREFNSS